MCPKATCASTHAAHHHKSLTKPVASPASIGETRHVVTSAVALLIAASAAHRPASLDRAASNPPAMTANVKAVATIFSYYDIPPRHRRRQGRNRRDPPRPPASAPTSLPVHPQGPTRPPSTAASLIIKNGLQPRRLGRPSSPPPPAPRSSPSAKTPNVLNSRSSRNRDRRHAAPDEHAATQHDHAARSTRTSGSTRTVQIKAAENSSATPSSELSIPPTKPTFDANAAKPTWATRSRNSTPTSRASHRRPSSRKDFIGFHAAYAYLAHRYGLRQKSPPSRKSPRPA